LTLLSAETPVTGIVLTDESPSGYHGHTRPQPPSPEPCAGNLRCFWWRPFRDLPDCGPRNHRNRLSSPSMWPSS